MRLVTRVPRHTAFFDLVYAPAETTMLRHARWAGRRALNGQGMIVFQAAAAFVDHIARPLLERTATAHTIRERVVETMGLNWGTLEPGQTEQRVRETRWPRTARASSTCRAR